MRPPAALLLIAIGMALSGCGGGAASVDATANKALNVPAAEELMREGPLGERAIGNPNAPVTVIEYASLTCPHCAHFQRDVWPRVKKEFIDTGKIRFIVREFPIGRTSGAAAIATRCVPPEKYFALHSAFLLRQPEWVSQEVRPDAIYAVAKSSGITRAAFDTCMANQTIIDGLTEVKQRGRQFGVIGTPTFYANGRKAQGTITFEQFKALIDPQSPS
ncbi:MAG: DsbA family protein [Methyloceanibacter sp.]|jgi:protein-disulfide isomerase